MGGSKSVTNHEQAEVITPAVAKDAQIAQTMSDSQRQERSMRRGISSTYARFNGMSTQPQGGNGTKSTLG